MITGPRYKIARRLGPNVFDKTQSQKFALRSDKKTPSRRKMTGSDFALQLLEKQKARTTYGMGEKQFKNLVEKLIAKRLSNTAEAFVQALEMRLDNTVYRLGFVNSRQASRQIVSHGHINVNGKRITIPSYKVEIGDVISIRELSLKKGVFKDLNEKTKEARVPSWLSYDVSKHQAKVEGLPKIAPNEVAFDVPQIIQYYSK